MTLSKKSLKKLRAILLEITPEITAILDDFLEINRMRQAVGDEAADNGVEIIKQFLDMLLVRRYDGILKMLSAIYEIPPRDLEEKELGEIIDMAMETLADKALVRFFPQLQPLAPKTPSAA